MANHCPQDCPHEPPTPDHSHDEHKRCHVGEPITAPSWQCGVAQAKGIVMHDGHLYVNLVDGNLADPALGVGAGTYAGAFDLASLIAYVIANP